jgi:hypothetical protein
MSVRRGWGLEWLRPCFGGPTFCHERLEQASACQIIYYFPKPQHHGHSPETCRARCLAQRHSACVLHTSPSLARAELKRLANGDIVEASTIQWYSSPSTPGRCSRWRQHRCPGHAAESVISSATSVWGRSRHARTHQGKDELLAAGRSTLSCEREPESGQNRSSPPPRLSGWRGAWNCRS